MLDLHEAAVAAGRTLVPGAGFGVAATESVVAMLCAGRPIPERVRTDMIMDHGQGHPHLLSPMYGDDIGKVKVAWLSSGNGVGFEVFEFTDPPTRSTEDRNRDWTLQEQFQRAGFFHIAITTPDPEAVCQKACEDGARQVGQTTPMYDGEKALYLKDPFGNVVELLSSSFEQSMSNRG